MQTRSETLAAAVRNTAPLVTRYLAGFDDTNHTAQPPGLPNHAAWTLGHVALTLHRCAELADRRPLPDDDFRTDEPTPTGRIPMRFYTEDVCFDSQPADERMRYPSMESCVLIYERAVDRLAQAVEHCNEDQLDQEHPWGNAAAPYHLLISRMIFHAGMHTGQLADTRRALALGSIF